MSNNQRYEEYKKRYAGDTENSSASLAMSAMSAIDRAMILDTPDMVERRTEMRKLAMKIYGEYFVTGKRSVIDLAAFCGTLILALGDNLYEYYQQERQAKREK